MLICKQLFIFIVILKTPIKQSTVQQEIRDSGRHGIGIGGGTNSNNFEINVDNLGMPQFNLAGMDFNSDDINSKINLFNNTSKQFGGASKGILSTPNELKGHGASATNLNKIFNEIAK